MPQSGRPTEWQNSLQFLLGWRELDDTFWAPVEDQGVVGFEFQSHHPTWGLGVEIGANGGLGFEDNVQNTGIDLESTTAELYGGLRYTLDLDRFHPYVGTGVSMVYAEVEGITGPFVVRDDDTSVAGYVHGGLLFDVADNVNTGFDVRYLYGSDIELLGIGGDADFFQLAWTIGARF